MTKLRLIPTENWFRLIVLMSLLMLAVLPVAHSRASQPVGTASEEICQEAVEMLQKKDFYEGLAVLAQSNLEKFFIPQHRKALHAQLLDGENRLTFPQSIWWRSEDRATQVSFAVEPTIEEPNEGEIDQIMNYRLMDTKEMTGEDLKTQLALEKKLHLALYSVHQESLESYRKWAFGTFSPLRAYQRIFENYLSSSVWWNTYVAEYASTLAKIYDEQKERTSCTREMLWTSLGPKGAL